MEKRCITVTFFSLQLRKCGNYFVYSIQRTKFVYSKLESKYIFFTCRYGKYELMIAANLNYIISNWRDIRVFLKYLNCWNFTYKLFLSHFPAYVSTYCWKKLIPQVRAPPVSFLCVWRSVTGRVTNCGVKGVLFYNRLS